MSLKIYGWEEDQFPWQHTVMIRPDLRVGLTQALARAWGMTKGSIPVDLSTRGNGSAFLSAYGCRIALPGPRYRCSLALIVHELAHVYDWVTFKHSGHDKTFKKALIKLMVEVRTMKMLVPILADIRRDQSYGAARWQKRILADQERSRKAQEARDRAASPQGRLERVQALIKRLQARQKRAERALAKARRRERALQRSIERGMGYRLPQITPISGLITPLPTESQAAGALSGSPI